MSTSPSTVSHTYVTYGQSIRSTCPLPFLKEVHITSVDFDFVFDASVFNTRELRAIVEKLSMSDWFHRVNLADGSLFIRWSGLFEFLVSAEGRRIICHPLRDDSSESFYAYLLGHVLSFAMVRQGIEPLHATVVVVDGQAVAFLGDSGYGKSTLAGAFIQAGFQLLTDDMLIVRKKNNEFLAHPSPPRIKLFPDTAKDLLSDAIVGTPMNPETEKLIIPLSDQYVSQAPVPLKLFYALQEPGRHNGKLAIQPLHRSQALLAFVQNTFNPVVRGQERLTRQFSFAAELSANLPVKSLSYPRELSFIPKVMDAVLKDIE